MAEEKTKLKKYWVEQAVACALQGRWADAVTANQNILSLFPSDAEAYNRLGKAYTELGRYDEARDSYARALQLDPGNSIAEKNLQRLKHLQAAPVADTPVVAEAPVEPHLFIEELGKSTTTTLVNTAGIEVLARMSAGDPVRLSPNRGKVVVENVRGERLGELETKLGQRLISLMRGGNRYTAAVASLDNGLRVIIRETYQHPSQAGRVSFPAKGGETTFRSYIKDSALKYDLDEEEEENFEEQEVAGDVEIVGEEPTEEGEPLDEDLAAAVPSD